MATITSLGFSIFSRYDGSGVTRAQRDINSLNDSINRTNGGLNSFTGRLNAAAAAAVALGPALLPIAETAAAGAGALAVMGVTAGSALGIYAAATKGAIDRTLEMADAGQKLTASQSGFVTAVRGMQSAWNQFIVSTQDMTLDNARIVVEGITGAIGRLRPVVVATNPIIREMAIAFRDWAAGEGFQRFIDNVIQFGVPALRNLVAAGRDILAVLGFAFRALLPLSVDLSEAIAKGAAALRRWAEGGGFERFLERVRQNGPAVRDFFRELWDFLQKVLDVARLLAPQALELATNLMRLVNGVPPERLAQIATAFAAMMVISQIIGPAMALARTFALLSIAVGASSGGGLAGGVSALAGGFGRLLPLILRGAGLIGAFVGAVILAWQHSEFFRDRVEQLWQQIQILWRDHLQPLIQKLQELWEKLEPVRQAIGFVAGLILGIFVQALTNAVMWLGLFADAAVGVIDFFINLPGWIATAATAIAAWVTEWSTRLAEWVALVATTVASWVSEWATRLAAWVATAATTVAQWVSEWATQLATWVASAATIAGQWVAEWTTRLAEWVALAVTTVASWIAEWATQLATWVASAATIAGQWVAEWTTQLAAWVALAVSTVASWIAEWSTQLASWVATAATTGAQWVAEWATQLASWVAEGAAKLGEWTAQFATQLATWVAEGLAKLGEWIAGWVTELGRWSAETLSGFANWIAQWATQLAGWVAEGLATLAGWVASFVAEMGRWSVETLSGFANWIAQFIAEFGRWSVSMLTGFANWIATFIAEMGRWSVATLTGFANWIAQFIAEFGRWSVSMLTGFANWIASFIAEMGRWSVATLTGFANWIAEFIAQFGQWSVATLTGLGNWILEFIQMLGQWATDTITGIANWITDLTGRLADCWEEIRSVAETAWGLILGVIEDAINAILTPINLLIDGFNAIGNVFGLDDVPNIEVNFAYGGMVGKMPGFAAGGTVNMTKGGALSGYSPGRDTVPAMLSRGEGVLVPEAVRGLGGPAFVHGANHHFSNGRAGKGGNWHSGNMDGHFAKGGMVGVQHFAVGGITAAALARAGVSLGMVTQGEFSNGALSAGTHSGGGAVDIASSSPALVAALRAAGFAAWARGPAQGFSPHIHAVLIGHPQLSGPAAAQVQDFLAGGDGLGAGGGGGGAGGGGIDIFGGILGHVKEIIRGIVELEPVNSVISEFLGPLGNLLGLGGGEEEEDDGGGFLGSGIGPDIGPDIVPGDIGETADRVTGAVGSAIGGTIGGSIMQMVGQMIFSALSIADLDFGFQLREDAIGDADTGSHFFGDLMKGGANWILDGAKSHILDNKPAMPTFAAAGGGSAMSVQQWAPLALQAMALGGLAASQLPAFLALMQAESGGNPLAINRTDINAQNGVPSQGLMQVIPPTFAAFHVPGTSNNILDPLANMAAAAAYIRSRYGGNVPGSPYGLGTPGATAGWHLVGERGSEWVKFRGGERVLPNGELPPGNGGERGEVGSWNPEFNFHIQGNMDERAVDKFRTEVVPELRRALEQKVGRRP